MPSIAAGSPAPRRLLGLDAMRGIAAICVLAFHAAIPSPRFTLGGMGYLAVDFFFMLSGYVMARTYEHRFAEGYSTRRFMLARYRRLWPVMAISTLIGAPMLALELNDPVYVVAAGLANLMLIPAIGSHVMFPANSAAWSILAELCANLAHGRWLRRLPVRRLLLVAAAMLPVMVWTCLTWGTIGVGASWATGLSGVARAIMAYSIGIVLWRRWRDEPGIRIPPLAAFVAMPAAMLIGHLAGASWLFEIGFVLLLCPLLIAGALAYRGSHGLAAWAGMISFPLYAINTPLMHWASGLAIGAIPAVAFSLLLASYLAIRMNAGPAAARSPAPESYQRPPLSVESGRS